MAAFRRVVLLPDFFPRGALLPEVLDQFGLQTIEEPVRLVEPLEDPGEPGIWQGTHRVRILTGTTGPGNATIFDNGGSSVSLTVALTSLSAYWHVMSPGDLSV